MADKDLTEFINYIGKDFRLTHIIALITTTITAVVDIGYMGYYLVSDKLTDWAVVAVIGALTAVLATYFWVEGIISGSYVNGAIELGKASISGGEQQPSIAGITSSGVIYTGLTADDIVALNNLIATNKLNPSIVALLNSMTPDQIKAVIQQFSK